MKAERDGRTIAHWGGDKAGSRQAQAVFALLFDRGERGVGKDEATEMLWPDGAAAARYRQALSVNPDNERALAAIDRLG